LGLEPVRQGRNLSPDSQKRNGPVRAIASIIIMALTALPLFAQSDELDRFSDAMQMDAVVDILRQEGIAFGEELGSELFTPSKQEEWRETLVSIYNADWMYDVAMAGVAESLSSSELNEISGYFETPLGKQIVALEISGRRALMDDAIVEAANETAKLLQEKGGHRIDLINRFIEINALLETNVVGALNSNYAFSIGLMDGGFFPSDVTQGDILNEVWSQEAQITSETEEWLMSYLLLSYQPLTDAELEQYVDWSATAVGQALNDALFKGFDSMFDEISYALGFAVGRMIQSPEEL